MTTKSMGYDHPAYTTRNYESLNQPTAGASAATAKFVAFTALSIFAVIATLVTSGGTSTATAWNGTATTTAIGAQSYSVIRVFNTATAGATPALGTATYGPFALSLYNGTATGTQTNSTATGLSNYVQLYNANGTATGQVQAGTNTGSGGFQVNQGDILYVVQGTDATAVGNYTLELSVTPLAAISN